MGNFVKSDSRNHLANLCRVFLLFLMFVFAGSRRNAIYAQEGRLAVKGYLQYENNTWAPPSGDYSWKEISGLHNRLDINWYPGKHLSFYAGVRNNLDFGSLLSEYYPEYKNSLVKDNGFVNMTLKITDKKSCVLYSNIDRLNFKLQYDKLEIKVGRQRINWGLNSIWNPGDIFNTYNYFDFSYISRPGSDAALVQYFTGNLSSLQIAAKLDNNDKLTSAAMYKFNLKGYDIQILGGVMNGKYMVLGGGWSGQIKGGGFTGEINYFKHYGRYSTSGTTGASTSYPNIDQTSSRLVASVAYNYTFSNQIFINTSVIYNSRGTTGKVHDAAAGNDSRQSNFLQTNSITRENSFLQTGDLSPLTLTLSKCELFGEISYPFTPLIKGDFSAILNPYDGSAFLGPSADISLTDNIQLLAMAQIFTGKKETEYGNYGRIYYVRLKWTF